MVAIIYLLFEPLFLRWSGTPSVYPLPVCTITVIGDVLFYLCVILTVVSGLDYLLKNLALFKESK